LKMDQYRHSQGRHHTPRAKFVNGKSTTPYDLSRASSFETTRARKSSREGTRAHASARNHTCGKVARTLLYTTA
jgi:hypothetical protein